MWLREYGDEEEGEEVEVGGVKRGEGGGLGGEWEWEWEWSVVGRLVTM